MGIPKKLTNFLEKNKINYEPIEHRVVYTAYDKTQTLKVPEKIVGKTLVVKFNRDFALVLIPANKNLDKNKFRKITKTRKVDFISEKLIKKKFMGVKVGAIPPFGNLFKVATFIDRSLINQPKIIINAGDWKWSIKINPANFKRIISNLVVGSFSKSRL